MLERKGRLFHLLSFSSEWGVSFSAESFLSELGFYLCREFLSECGGFSQWGFFSQSGEDFFSVGRIGEAAAAIGHKVHQARPPTAAVQQ